MSLSAYEQWLQREDADLVPLLESALAVLRTMFDAGPGAGPGLLPRLGLGPGSGVR